MNEDISSNPLLSRDDCAATTRVRPLNGAAALAFDYRNQAWLKNGRYMRCGHTEPCGCYGRLHEGGTAALDVELH